jgi:DNA polymerase-3 subunit gamma/tau
MERPMLSLYRRHRPRTFDSVMGQEHIVKTLRNAIALDKVHHAYLFVGSRGTGKTSMAKLLACALNAEGGASADFDPETPTAKAILNGTSLDVVEMDAASNNSVDDIRDLRENVALAPMQGGKRVYILDEAHMLTTAAWNAFLKTLEEPPAHVVFVLATTEAHKVPPTIIDRCHRFDFQRPSLEQLVTYGGTDVKLDDVLEILGVADAELVLAAGEALADRDPRAALLTVQSLSESGRDFTQFMRDLSAHLRHLFVVQTLGHVPDSFSVAAEQTERMADQAGRMSQGEILRAIDFLAGAIAAVKDGSEPRLQLEMALLKATQPQADLSLQALMFRIDQLERAAGVAPVDAPPSPPPVQRQAPKGAAAVAVEPQAVGSIELGQIVSLWPAIAQAVGEENGMLGAALSAATPLDVAADRLTIAFPADAAFVKKKAEQGRDLVANAVRGMTGQPLTLAFELSDAAIPTAGPATLDHEQLIERLRAEFGAEEIFEDPDEEKD